MSSVFTLRAYHLRATSHINSDRRSLHFAAYCYDTHPGLSKTAEAFERKFYPPLTQATLRQMAQNIVQGCTGATTKLPRGAHPDNQEFFPVPTYLFASIAIGFSELPATQFCAVKYDYLMVMVDRPTGYVLALRGRTKGLTAEKAAELFVERCVFLMGLPKAITADNAGIINVKFRDTLFALS